MIYTFYSFKGGVGRSMAMASAAYLLAQRGLRVLAIDFDLEAPGLERYFFDSRAAADARARPGLVELLLAYKRALTSEEEFRRASFRDWRQFVQSAVPTVLGGGSVELMSAGQREPVERYGAYAAEVRQFDWLDFFHQWKGERFFDWLRNTLEQHYDAVLVDSRTGITEMGGVCAYQLADVVVMLCAANEQNLEGTQRVAQDFQHEATLALRGGRPLQLLVLPARLEAQNERRREFLDKFAKAFPAVDYLPRPLQALGVDAEQLALPYEPAFAVIEQIVGESGGDAAEYKPGETNADTGRAASQALRHFERLADALVLLAPAQGRLLEAQDQARVRLAGGVAGDGRAAQVADATRAAADLDVLVDEPSTDAVSWPPLARQLAAAGLRVGRLDAPVTGSAGDMSSAARDLVSASRAVLVLFHGPEVSPWTSQLIDEARRQERPILPAVVASPGEAADFSALRRASLGHLTALTLDARRPESWSAQVREALQALRRSAPAVASSANAAEPYVGLRPFGEADEALFFGRAAERQALLELLDQHPCVLLSGAAGQGKTSLLRAGLMAAWRDRGSGSQRLYLDAAQQPDLCARFERWRAELGGPAADGLVVVDHIDTMSGTVGAGLAQRLDEIGRLLAQLPAGMRCVLALRGVLTQAQRQGLRRGSGTNDVLFAPLELAPMAADQLAQAIERPAARHGHVVEAGLVSLLIGQAGRGPGATAELARALPELWRGRRRGWLVATPLEAAGGIAGLYRRAAQAVLDGLSEPERDAVRVLVQSLMRLDSAMRWTTAVLPWSWVSGLPAWQAVDGPVLRDRLADAHLIDLAAGDLRAAGFEPMPGGEPVEPMVSLVHEPPQLLGDLLEVRLDPGFTLWRQSFLTHVNTWLRGGQAADALLAQQVLHEAEAMAARQPGLLAEPEQALIAQSQQNLLERERQHQEVEQARQAAEQQLRQQEQARRLRQRAALVIGLLLVVAAGTGWGLWGTAERARADAVTARKKAEDALAEVAAQKQIAEDRLRRMRAIIDSIPQAELRGRLLQEHFPGAAPTLTAQQQQTLALAASAAQREPGSRAAPRAGADWPGYKLWRNGSVLRMRFMGGTASQQAMAKAAADEWSRHANIRFEVVTSGDAELRITFDPKEGSWAFQGADALGVSQREHNMNLGIPEPDRMLHEFGHVLGLVHEFQTPSARLPWRRETVIAELSGPPNFWSPAVIETNVLSTVNLPNYRAFDPDSIMMFEFPGTWFTDGKARGGAKVLSASDKAFVGRLYPR